MLSARGIVLVAAWMLAVGMPAAYAANSARCVALGANCIADEPLNTDTIADALSNTWFDPADTTSGDKQASSSGVIAGGAIEVNSPGVPFTPVNSGEDISALPAGHTITWVQRSPTGNAGGAISTKFPAGAPTALRAFGFYRYYSIDHAWTNDPGLGACNSGKVFQGGTNGAFSGGPLVDIGVDDKVSFYDISTASGFDWTLTMQPNCCSTAPGSTLVTVPTRAQLRGHWWRIEFLLHNAAPGGTTYFEMYLARADNTASEVKVIDSRVAMTSDGPDSTHWWQSPMTDGLGVNAEQTEFTDNLFRNNGGDPCTGFISSSMHTWAAWDTDAGQRIGAAVEIEGSGGGGSSPRRAPLNLRIAESEEFAVAEADRD